MTDIEFDKWPKKDLVELVRAALADLPQAKRDLILARHRPKSFKSEPAKFLQDVESFVKDSLAGKFYDPSIRKNSRGWPEDPPLTRDWCDGAERLCMEADRLAGAGEHDAAARALEQILRILHRSQGDDEIVYADEFGIDLYVAVDFKKLLRIFFSSLAKSATPEEFARRGLAVANLETWKEKGAPALLKRIARGPYRSALRRAGRRSRRARPSRRPRRPA